MSLKNRGSIQALLATIGLLVVAGLGLGLCGAGVIDQYHELAARQARAFLTDRMQALGITVE